jgi:hypothetical protein
MFITLGEEAKGKLDHARDLLRHKVPDGDLATVTRGASRVGRDGDGIAPAWPSGTLGASARRASRRLTGSIRPA